MSEYEAFLASKEIRVAPQGIAVDDNDIHPSLFPFQRALVAWAAMRGRAALFCGTGLGKTRMQIEWARLVSKGKAIILAPLAVGAQTIREAATIGVRVHDLREDWTPRDGLNVVNYDSLHKIDPAAFDAVVLDESSILKNFTGATREALIEAFRDTPYRLACTATPAPNDTSEIGNHAEFLGIMRQIEMCATWFVHDEQSWRLKGHAAESFYKWIASWAMFVQFPSDLGFEDDGYILPPLDIAPVIVPVPVASPGSLFFTGMGGVKDRSDIRKSTAEARIAATVEMVNADDEPWIVWCGLNLESERAAEGIRGAVEVTGAMSDEEKEAAIGWFLGWSCPCGSYRAKLPACSQTSRNSISESTTLETENEDSLKPSHTNGSTPQRSESIRVGTTERTSTNGSLARESSGTNTTQSDEPNTLPTRAFESERSEKRKTGRRGTQKSGSRSDSRRSALQSKSTDACSMSREEGALSAGIRTPTIGAECDSMSTIATPRGSFEGSCAPDAISDSGSSEINRSALSGRQCICGRERPRVLVSKVSIIGFGINAQSCASMAFLGLSDSYEGYYQAIRRCYRFGQTRSVRVRIVIADVEQEIVQNVKRKEIEASELASRIVASVRDYERESLKMSERERDNYREESVSGDGWTLHNGDCVETMKRKIATDSVDLSVFSPPFSSLFTYSNSPRDIGNCKNDDEFWTHFRFAIPELLRVTKPGRLAAVHIANVPAMLSRDGYIGVKDIRGDLVREFIAAGWIFHGEVTIDKCPQAQAIRTKSKSLLFVQKERDSSWLRPALADYICVFRKPGENAVPIQNDDVTREDWIEWARPIWYGIKEADTLQVREAREDKDERHLCPLQLGTIERCIRLWSNKGETVFTPFLGIGSEAYQAVRFGRKALGVELKASYFRCAVANVRKAEAARKEEGLFGMVNADA